MVPIVLVTILVVQILPSISHRLITDPYQGQHYDSVIVSSDSITIREKKQNYSVPVKPNQILRPQKRSYEECLQNDLSCLYGIVGKFSEQYSNGEDAKYEKNLTDENNSRKPHWTIIDSQKRRHTHDDKDGWVTLDPVPWSTSKVSKWHPYNVVPQHETQPAIYESSAQQQQQPMQQFWMFGLSPPGQRPSSQWGIGINDIITDNKPSDFPHHGYGNTNHHTAHTQGLNHPQQETYNSQGSFSGYRRTPVKATPFTPLQNTLPATYPNNGNGEWVLLSANKGYSHPRGHRRSGVKDLATRLRPHSTRNIKPFEISKYQEENLKDNFVLNTTSLSANRKSDVMADFSNGSSDGNETTLQILYTGPLKSEEATTTTRRKVRLQVLPASEEGSTAYGGLLEVDDSAQTVDETHEEDEKLKNLKAIATVKKNKIRGYKLIPASKFTGKSSNHKNMMTLAAVGAGMIPATMALLVPMALGRRKRSLFSSEASNELHPGTLHKRQARRRRVTNV